MRGLSIIIGLTAVCGVSFAISEAGAQPPPGGRVVCATTLSNSPGTASTYVDISTINPSTCKSSIILAFEGNVPVLNNVREQIQLAVEMCDLWDGPYRRIKSGETGGNANLDYVVIEANNVPSSFNVSPATANAADQIGVPGTIRAKIFGTTSNQSAVVNLVDESHLSGPVASQTLDYPGPEFMYMAKSQGGGTQATLLCAVNAWFWANIPTSPLTLEQAANYTFAGSYGFSAYPVPHNVNQLTAGWGAGPSALLNTANINAACGSINGALTQAVQSPQNSSEPRQQYAGRIIGTYKVGATSADSPSFNITNCAAKDFPNDRGSYESVCTTEEPSGFGRPNSCNPEGGLGNGINANVIQTKNGQNTTCPISFGSGTRLSNYSTSGRC
jgi:hypothetical protein